MPIWLAEKQALLEGGEFRLTQFESRGEATLPRVGENEQSSCQRPS
jgi:hypothetical protein